MSDHTPAPTELAEEMADTTAENEPGPSDGDGQDGDGQDGDAGDR